MILAAESIRILFKDNCNIVYDISLMEFDKTKQGAPEDIFACCCGQIFLAELEKIFSQEGEDEDITLSNCIDKCPDVWDRPKRLL